MNDPPDGWDESGSAGGRQGECIWGEFGSMIKNRINMATREKESTPVSKRITAFVSGGMSACSAIFLYFVTDTNTRVGAVIHFDSGGDPGTVFNWILRKYGMDNDTGRRACVVTLVTHFQVDQTGKMAYNCLTGDRFPDPSQFSHRGAAGMDADGNVFDHYAG